MALDSVRSPSGGVPNDADAALRTIRDRDRLLNLVVCLLPAVPMTLPKMTGVMYAIDAQYHILVRFTAEGGVMSGAGPSVVLEADVLAGPVSEDLLCCCTR